MKNLPARALGFPGFAFLQTQTCRLLPALALVALALLAVPLRCLAATFTVTDSEGLTAWVRTPTDTPDPAKTYWVLVSVHGVQATGKDALGWFSDWTDFDDVILLFPTFGPPTEKGQAGRKGSYQMSAPAHEAKLEALVAELNATWKLHPKLILNGFSAGAQFVHRFAMHHPERVAGVAAHSGGSWAKPEGDDRINPAARTVPFAVSCGEADNGGGVPGKGRLEAARVFAASLKSLDFTIDFQTWPDVAHAYSPGAKAQTRALVERIRAAPPFTQP